MTTIHETILEQLGGRRFVVMTGSKNFIYANVSETISAPWLRMDLTRNKNGYQRLKITLEANDTYTLHFYRMKKDKNGIFDGIAKEKIYSDIYGDQLAELFTEETGLYTKL